MKNQQFIQEKTERIDHCTNLGAEPQAAFAWPCPEVKRERAQAGMPLRHDPYANFQSETLPNGLSISVKELDTPWIYVGFACHAGAKEDPIGRDGMAHLVEHLVSENVEGFSYETLDQYIRSLGGYGSFGTTGYLGTSYHLFLPDEETALTVALSLFGQMLITAQLTRGIEEEKMIATREFHAAYPFRQAHTWKVASRQALFAPHTRLSGFSRPLGTPEEFQQCTAEELQTFYDRYYIPSNMSVVSIGHLSREHLAEALQKSLFGRHKPGQRNPLAIPFAPVPPHPHECEIHLSEWSHLSYTQAHCEFTWVLPTGFDDVSLWLFRHLLEEQLTRELRLLRGFTYDVTVHGSYYQDCQDITVTVETPAEAIPTIQEIIGDMIDQSLDEETFHGVKQGIMNGLLRPDLSGEELLDLAMDHLIADQRLCSFSEQFGRVVKVTFEQMQEIAAYLIPERQFRLIMRP
jgi:predicted Zn-dependent peptidase